MSWTREGQIVSGIYQNSFTVIGKVTFSRVKYGAGMVQHTLELFTPIEIYGTMRTHVLLDENELLSTSKAGE